MRLIICEQTRFEKPTMYTRQVKCILLLHIIDTFMYYSKHNDKIARGGQVCFSTQLFLDHAKY